MASFLAAPTQADGVFQDGFEDCSGGVGRIQASLQIADARAAADGPTTLPISGALVTYVKPAIGNDPAGFFVQACRTGPSLFVATAPELLEPTPEAGDAVQFTITAMGSSGGLRQATAIDWQGINDVALPLLPLQQDLSAATDLVTGAEAYESELMTIAGSVAGAFAASGSGFESAPFETVGILGDARLRLRLPATLRDASDVVPGCVVAVGPTPFWRFGTQTQVSAWHDVDLELLSCPPPVVLTAVALSASQVHISFDRRIDPASVVSDGSQFVFDNGLVASSATVAGRSVDVTTSAQTPGTPYGVQVQSSVTDTLGSPVAAGSAAFSGFEVPAVLRISELNANLANGCDLVELAVLEAGSMGGITLRERQSVVLTFSSFNVSSGDRLVVHFDGGDIACNPGGATSETASIDAQPALLHPANFDSAWDWYTSDTGLTSTDNVLTVYTGTGSIQDAVFVTDDSTGTAAADTESQAAVVAGFDEWTMEGGGIPPGGFVDDDFNAHAVLDLNGTATTPSGTSIQRTAPSDSNTKADWTMAPSTWGVP